MASGSLPIPGSEYGECLGVCQHIDCAANHAMARVACRICKLCIDYDRQFYDETPINGLKPIEKSYVASFVRNSSRILVHAVCLHEEIKRNREANALAEGVNLT